MKHSRHLWWTYSPNLLIRHINMMYGYDFYLYLLTIKLNLLLICHRLDVLYSR